MLSTIHRLNRQRTQFALSTLLLFFISLTTAHAGTLENVKKQGYVNCGVSQGLPGFSNLEKDGQWSGIDVDFCRAIAAAVFSDKSKVRFTPLSAKERFTALQSGEIDVLSRNTTWTASRDTSLGIHFAGVIYYDGQGFMVRKDLGVSSAKELDGATLCANTGTTTELNMSDYFRSNGMQYKPVIYEKYDEVLSAYESGRCDVLSTDLSGLYAQRLRLKDANAHTILPEVISKEPLGPAVRQGDDQWFNIIKWTLYALLEAEELNITKKAAMQKNIPTNPQIRRFLGFDGNLGQNLGLTNQWAKHIILAVGHYGEMYERTVGSQSLLRIPREHNSLWKDGGLHYAPPFR
ncbi:amino acid ABC transporter substrate-binding protein [Gammaproteobacteria bacterium 45_16_T64]|nr:amino acid ABC transporter substrate-binding protein [Gammaproteobacteria bacterium 45_16_T64]